MLTDKPQQETFTTLFAAGAEPKQLVTKDADNAHVRRPGLSPTRVWRTTYIFTHTSELRTNSL